MNKFMLGSAALIVLAAIGSAGAADLPVKAPPMAPVVAPVYNWTGCYIGGNVGVGWTNIEMTRVSQDTIGPAPADYGSQTDSSLIGGGQVGCDYQMGQWVFGVKGQFDWGNLKGSNALPTFPTFTMFDSVRNIDTVTGRIGYAFQPNVLLYAQGGVAWKRDNFVLFGTVPTPFLSESLSDTRTGFDVGAGVEWMFAPSWSVFVEYNFMGFDTKGEHFIAPPANFPPGEIVNVKQSAQSVLVGVNWRFNFAGPVVARY